MGSSLSRRGYAALSAEDQQVLREVMSATSAASIARRATTTAARRSPRELRPADGHRQRRDVEVWRAAREHSTAVAPAAQIDAAMLDRLLAMLAEYRRTHP